MIIAYSINGIILICVFCAFAFSLKTGQQSLEVLSEQPPGESLLTQTSAEGQPVCPYAFIYVSLDRLHWGLKGKKKNMPRSVKLLLLFHFYYFSLKATNKKYFQRLLI